MIAELITALNLGKAALDALKGAKDLLPDSPQKATATASIEQASHAFQIAEAHAAQQLGFRICQCSWPPAIMLRVEARDKYACPRCGYTVEPVYAALC